MEDAIRSLRAAEPDVGIKAIVKRLAGQYPDIDARAVRSALATCAAQSEITPAPEPTCSALDEHAQAPVFKALDYSRWDHIVDESSDSEA